MASRTRATAPRPPPAAVLAPRQPPPPPPPAARRRRQGLPAPPGRVTSGRPEEEPRRPPALLPHPNQAPSGRAASPRSTGPGGKGGGKGCGMARRRPGRQGEVNRSATTSFRKLKKSTQANADMGNENTIAPTHPAAMPAWKARATAASPPPPNPMSSTLPASATIKNPASKVNRPVTRSISQSARANAAVANDNDTTDMRTGTDDIEFLRRRLIISESEVVKEKDNVRRGLEQIRRMDAQLLSLLETAKHSLEMAKHSQEIAKRQLERESEMIGCLRNAQDLLQKLEAEKEAEILELKVQKQAEILHKEAEVQEVIAENIRLLYIVDKKEAQLQAMNEHCKFLALKNTTTDAADNIR